MNLFPFSPAHQRWCRSRQRLYGGMIAEYRELIAAQDGKCAFSGVPLIFESEHGGGFTPGCQGCHPLYATLDHCSPGSQSHGYQIVCYALNDLKGHLPFDCFLALVQTEAWKHLMGAWRLQQQRDQFNRGAFRALLRPPTKA